MLFVVCPIEAWNFDVRERSLGAVRSNPVGQSMLIPTPPPE
jgi:hypothetical protein